MKSWLKRLAIGLAAGIAVAAGGIYVLAHHRLSAQYDEPLLASTSALPAPTLAEAERKAHSLMCFGCHREAGNAILNDPLVGTLVAPNLSRIAPLYTDAELERLLRRGVKKDGTAAIAMPSSNFARLADEDIKAIVTYLRHLPPRPDAEPSEGRFGPLGLVALALGKVEFDADKIGGDPAPLTRPKALGRYLVDATCSHCHEMNAEHDNGFGMKTPGLKVVIQAYDATAFKTMLRTGKGTGDRDLGLMSEEARLDFSHLNDAEIDAIYRYLRDEGE
jgi:cytochrome c553